jgi:segregation and condensation protein A
MDGMTIDPAALEGGTPRLTLAGFNGSLERLLTLARAHQVDLARISLRDLVEQLSAALQKPRAVAPPGQKVAPLGQKGDWVVMAAWLLLLRSQLLLPEDLAAQQAAETEASDLRGRMLALGEMQALAGWLDRRDVLGRDVFARGTPEAFGTVFSNEPDIDVIEFLWASLALFDDDLPLEDTIPRYATLWLDLYSIPDARSRILRLLADLPDGQAFERLLPSAPDRQVSHLRARSAWTSTFVATLELAKQGEVTLEQDGGFTPIRVSPADAAGPP